MNDEIQISKEQKAYGPVINVCEKTAFVLLVITFIIYIFNIIEPAIKPADLPNYWSLSLDEYLEQTHDTSAWGWTRLLNKSDYLNFLSVAVLASITFICYLRILPIYIKDKDKWYVVIVFAELIMLVLAMSGILAA